MSNKFLETFEKEVKDLAGVGDSSKPPRYYHSFGNYVLNRIMAGNFKKGCPQGRITGIAGPSGAGKSFIIGNLVRSAQKDGAIIFIIDSEEALDDDYMDAIGVNTVDKSKYKYKSVSTIPQVTTLVSAFVGAYKAEFENAIDAPKVFIAIDSLDMLMTDTEEKHFGEGVTKGDQGQRSKQLKAMLRTFVQAIKGTNISMAVTTQTYVNQDVTNGEGLWVVNNAIRFSLSQILLVSKMKLKDDKVVDKDKLGVKIDESSFAGINMKCVGFKTRFTKPFQEVTIQVPYDTGIDPFSGFLDVAVKLGVVTKKGSRYSMTGEDETWYGKDFVSLGHAEKALTLCENKTTEMLTVSDDEFIEDTDVDTAEDTERKLIKRVSKRSDEK